MNKKFFGLVLSSALLATSGFLVSCAEEEVVTPPATPKAKVLVTHASPDAPGVDLLVDNSKVNTAALAFPKNTGYLEVNAGTRNLKVNAAGTSTSVINADVPFEKDKNYSVFAVDSLSKITPVVFTDDLTAPAAGKAHVRVLHLSPNAPLVDIWIDGELAIPNVAFKQGSAFTPLSVGEHDFEVKLAGTSTVAISVPNFPLADKKIYTIFAKGFAGGTGTQALGVEVINNN